MGDESGEADRIVDMATGIISPIALETWAASREDMRQDQLIAYIERAKSFGSPIHGRQGIYRTHQCYMRKGDVGRAYCDWWILKQRTKETRRAALQAIPWDVYELDIVNRQPCLLYRFLTSKCPICESACPMLR